ncbi:MobH family relaxase [Xanthomonas campestris pv. raphani]|uniref:MobH family relaxase n=1 Tax=Xanthomonas campestris TaxID=339 RepID=UPI0023689B12|nr:MobH family relaxase [Xanthomonas campestris]MEA9822342.1 MobH family relaxase [Xanthomonas campestris pv. raphani]MEA9850925.1 MobH family relaxase [Xanthomonas campestris pv. raphani]MEA9855098.1 MobH family relaxase [Xanthomonas campestris pv. raphani]MEA9963785.1 MobH family relaxase [Xanthomonas campestris pv. raphani]WDJ20483.1 TraI domain-containing protein [Xanthomonas campestris pv. raphani]
MFNLFQRSRAKRPNASALVATPPSAAPSSLVSPQSAQALLSTARRQRLIEHIWQRTSLSRAQFDHLYRAPLQRYAELVQQFPASESHHHAYPGGMLDHGLEIVAYALKLRQSHLLPAGATPEAQAAQAEAWTAGVAYAALVHDLGKIAVDLEVEYGDGSAWHPWHGPLLRPYRFRYRAGREYRLHGAATGLLYVRVLNRDILDWLSGFPDLWGPLLYVLAGQHEHAGVLGELIVQADQASVAQSLGGDPAKALAAPRHALQRKLLDGLRYLLRDQLKLNQPEASDGWLTQDALWLVSKTVSDKLRAHLLSQGMEGIPTSNLAVFNVLQEHGIALPTPDGKAIWRATVRSDGGWSNTFTFLRLSPALVWDVSERPESFRGQVTVVEADVKDDLAPVAAADHPIPSASPPQAPESEAVGRPPTAAALPFPSAPPPHDGIDALLALMQPDAKTHEDAPQTPFETVAPAITPHGGGTASTTDCAGLPADGQATPSGRHFLSWLRHSIVSRRLVINDAKALVHTVADTAYLVSPGVFQRYAQEHPEVAALARQEKLPEWQWVQKQFEKLRVHRKQRDGLNIWTCEVAGPRKTRRLHGYLLIDPLMVLPQSLPGNPYLVLKEPAPESKADKGEAAVHG